MSAPFLAEIRIFGFNFAPTGWALCDGQLMPISQNTALFALLGTYYGGDGKATFALPNLDGSAALQWGQGPGLSDYYLGQSGGTDTVTLNQSETPAHSHTLNASNLAGDDPSPTNDTIARYSGQYMPPPNNSPTQLAPSSLPPQGGDQPHNNLQPYLVLEYCIALQGIFPQRP